MPGDGVNVVAWIGLALAVGGGLLSLLWYVTQQIAQERHWREEADDELAGQRQKLADDLAAYKLYVAQNHVTAQALRETEERLVTAFEKVAGRLETIVARLDRLALAMGKRGAES